MFTQNPAMLSHRSLKDVTIHRLVLTPTGTYNQMVRRPLQSAVDGHAVERLNSLTRGGFNIETSTLGTVANEFIQPSFQFEGYAPIENSWNQQRFSFTMEVTITQHNTVQRRILTGYTDHNEAIYHGNNEALLPDELMFFVNNSIILREVMNNVGGQSIATTNQVTSDQILRGNYARGNYAQSDKTMRPCDALAVTAIDFATNGAMFNAVVPTMAVDHRPTFGSGIQRASRSNMSSASYLSKSLNAIQSAYRTADDQSNQATIFNTASGIVKEYEMQNDQLMSVLGRDSDLMMSGRFSWFDLKMTDPTIEQRFQIAANQSNMASPIPVSVAGNTCNWDDLSTGSRAHEATIIGNCLSALMNDNFMTTVSFFVTNDTQNGMWDFRYTSEPMGFSEYLNLAPYMASFRDRFLTECLDGLSMYGQRRINLTVFADTLVDTHIALAMDGDTVQMPYCIPVFGDQLFSPFITNNNDRLLGLSRDLSNIVHNLDGSIDEIIRSSNQNSPQQQGFSDGGIYIGSFTGGL